MTFDQLTQYVIEVDGVPTVMPLTVTDTPMPEPESSGDPITPYIPPPSLDERVATVEEMNTKRLAEIAAVKQAAQVKDKPWKNLPASEKDKLLEAVCRMLGLYGGN